MEEEDKECYHESRLVDKQGKVRTLKVPVVQELARQGIKELPNMEEEDKECYHESRLVDKQGKVRTLKVPVVQELARQGIKELPKRFISLNPHSSVSNSPSVVQPVLELEALPCTINLAKLRDGSLPEVRGEELAKLANAAKNWGLFLIVDHGIPSKVLGGVKDVVQGFFDLSFQEKKASVGTYASTDNMGYGKNYVKSEDQPLDWIDRLTMKAAPPSTDQGLHVWPQKPPNFRESIEEYVAEARVVLNYLLEALAESLSVEGHGFLKYFDPKDSEINVRVNHYPPCPRPDLALGIVPHSDPSALTLLMQFVSNEGLQVLKDQNWVTLKWPQDQLLVNAGDLLEIMSNGLIKSPYHRVVTQRNVGRTSIALFYNPPLRAQIEPIANEGGNNYKEVVVEDYLQHYHKISPVMDKIPINFAKI